MTRRLFLATGYAAAAKAVEAPVYDDKKNLLFYIDSNGRTRPVRTPADWRHRVIHLRANMERVMGCFPRRHRTHRRAYYRGRKLEHYTRSG